MLTPMLVQYLVGLCCLRGDPEAVDVTVGDLVLDIAANKPRDVDITVTLHESDGSASAFKAYEVKREGEPLDVVTVEQLCIKLHDMLTVTHRAIVSASNFTDGAIAKASAHEVQLYVLKPWTEPLSTQFPEFKGVGPPGQFLGDFHANLLRWTDYRLNVIVPGGPSSFIYETSTLLFAQDGSPHKDFSNMGKYIEALLYRSTAILFPLEPAQTISRTFPPEPMDENQELEASPAWPHTHTLDVTGDQVFLKLQTGLAAIDSVTVSGRLQWQRHRRIPEFYVLERVPTSEVFAGAAVADWGSADGKMFAMIFAPDSRATHIHTFQLQEKHKHAIRQLKIPLPSDNKL